MLGKIHPLDVPLTTPRPYLGGMETIEARLRLVLETRPGRLPWRPDFGCDLASVVGEPATPQNLTRARFHVERAVARWVPEVKLKRCECRVIPRPDSVPIPGSAPAGEGALLSLGSQAVLSIQLELETTLGPLQLSTTVQP